MVSRVAAAVLIGSAILSAGEAGAADWRLISSSRTEFYFANMKASKFSDGIASGWVRKETGVDVEAMKRDKVPETKYTGRQTIVSFQEYDCVKKSKKTLTGMLYERDKTPQDLGDTDWEKLTDPADAAFAEGFCRELKKEAKTKK